MTLDVANHLAELGLWHASMSPAACGLKFPTRRARQLARAVPKLRALRRTLGLWA